MLPVSTSIQQQSVTSKSSLVAGLVLIVGAVCGVLVRLPFIEFLSHDIIGHLGQWYDYIVIEGGYHALADRFADYTSAYLYLLTAAVYLREYALPALSKVAAIKLPSLAFDVVLALSVYKLVGLTQARRALPALAAVCVLLLPTVVVNSALWGQADAMYVSLALLGVYCLCIDKPAFAAVWIGLALALKAQTIFIAPVLAYLLLKRRFKVWHGALIGGVYMLAMLPAILIGRPPLEALGSYVVQLNEYRQPSMGAPNLWSAVDNTFYHYSVIVGGIAAVVAGVTIMLSFVARTGAPSIADVIDCAMVSAAVLPFVLPKMHERYFFMADVLSVVIAFRRPKLWWLIVGYQVVSLSAYAGVLNDFFFALWPRQVLSLRLATLTNALLMVFIVWRLCCIGQSSRRIMLIGAVTLSMIGMVAGAMAPQFQRVPTWIAPGGMPADTTHTSITYGDAVELVGYYLPEPRPHRTGVMKIDLFFKPLHKLTSPFGIRAEAFSIDGTSLELASDGQPNPPMTDWQPGEMYIERKLVTIWPTVLAPQLATFRVSVIDLAGQALPIRCTAGPCSTSLGRLPIAVDPGTAEQWLHVATQVRFGSFIDLVSAQTEQVGATITTTLVWRAAFPSQSSNTVFVHVIDRDGRLVAQLDSPPRAGLYPTTVWHAGEVILDAMPITLPADVPAGKYKVRVGIYDSATLQRLPATRTYDQHLPNDEVDAGDVVVDAR